MISDCYADAGLPMIIPGVFFLICAFIPVVFIEAFVFHKGLNQSYWKALGPVAVGNIVSTFLGYPLAWGLLLAFEIITTHGYYLGGTTWNKLAAVTLQAAWLLPYENDLNWMVPAALMVILIPAFFTSVYSEYFVMKRFFRELSLKLIIKMSYKAHAVTYGVFWFALGVWTLYALVWERGIGH